MYCRPRRPRVVGRYRRQVSDSTGGGFDEQEETLRIRRGHRGGDSDIRGVGDGGPADVSNAGRRAPQLPRRGPHPRHRRRRRGNHRPAHGRPRGGGRPQPRGAGWRPAGQHQDGDGCARAGLPRQQLPHRDLVLHPDVHRRTGRNRSRCSPRCCGSSNRAVASSSGTSSFRPSTRRARPPRSSP